MRAPCPAGVVPNPQNLDLVNWILNQGLSARRTMATAPGKPIPRPRFRGAIWGLTDDIVFVNENVPAYGTIANAREIYELALANGEGFEAGEGDIIGLIVDPVQPRSRPRTNSR